MGSRVLDGCDRRDCFALSGLAESGDLDQGLRLASNWLLPRAPLRPQVELVSI
jgi:hypothetical protein